MNRTTDLGNRLDQYVASLTRAADADVARTRELREIRRSRVHDYDWTVQDVAVLAAVDARGQAFRSVARELARLIDGYDA